MNGRLRQVKASRELSRIRYLQAMGVSVYVSRRALPGAATSRKLYLRESVSKTAAHGEADAVSASRPGAAVPPNAPAGASPPAMPVKRGSPVPEHLREALHSPKPRARPATSERILEKHASAPVSSNASSISSQGEPGPQADVGERFRLAVLVSAGRLWVEDLGEDALASDQLDLVAAIGRALTHPECDSAAPRATQFVWPLHDNQQLDLGAGEAAASLGGFLRRQLDENACVELICLGEAAARRLQDLPLPCAKRTVRGTREVLAEPGLKAVLWDELRA